MNIFADKHHGDLAYSLQLLFEKRLGGNVYFPIGMEWATEGYWQIHAPYNYSEETAKQYLDVQQAYVPKDGTPSLNTIAGFDDASYWVEDTVHGVFHKAVTLEQFACMKIDVIIASIPAHYHTFRKLRDTFHPKAKLVCHMGNMFVEMHELLRNGTVQNLLASTIDFPVPQGVQAVFYHQEFDTNVYSYEPPKANRLIKSFVNCLKDTSDRQLWYDYKEALPDLTFKMHGILGDDGVINGAQNIAHAMKESMAIWHVKPGGDGYGHVLHTAAAIGRPLITRTSHYKGQLGEKLMVPDLTVIDLDRGGVGENCQKIQKLMQPDVLQRMSDNMIERFRQVVNFEKDAERVKTFMEELV